jgi:hypothetical protein
MSKTINTAIAAFLAASAFGGSAAFASSGDYYQGISSEQAQKQNIDTFRTNSIDNRIVIPNATAENVGPASGDYYQGVDPHAR